MSIFQGRRRSSPYLPTPQISPVAHDASSSAKTLFIMLLCVIVLLPIVLAYTAWVFHVLRGRITLEYMRKHGSWY